VALAVPGFWQVSIVQGLASSQSEFEMQLQSLGQVFKFSPTLKSQVPLLQQSATSQSVEQKEHSFMASQVVSPQHPPEQSGSLVQFTSAQSLLQILSQIIQVSLLEQISPSPQHIPVVPQQTLSLQL